MLLQEPHIEFISLDLADTIATSGSGYTVCEKIEGYNVSKAVYCVEVIEDNEASWEEICSWFEGDDADIGQ